MNSENNKPKIRKEKTIESTSLFRQAENLEREIDTIIQNMPARTYWRMGKPFEEALIGAREYYAMCYRHEKGDNSDLKIEYARKSAECFTQVDLIFRKWYKGEPYPNMPNHNVISKARHARLSVIVGELVGASWSFYQSLLTHKDKDGMSDAPAKPAGNSDRAGDVGS
ncbi:MAG: hypothetical protein E7075_00310 [Bacteroidales bacterium]|nr:hypothetical protein [Bacteroidales bacterium]